MNFTNCLWKSVEKIYRKILETEYIKGIESGKLDEKCFKHFICQDIIYLNHYTYLMKILVQRAENEDHKNFFLTLAKDSIEAEKELNRTYANLLGINSTKILSPAFQSYIDFLTENVCNSDYPVAITSMLPCNWIYSKLGRQLESTMNLNNKYEALIKSYASVVYLDFANKFTAIVEELGKNADFEIQNKMKKAFVAACTYELDIFVECGNV